MLSKHVDLQTGMAAELSALVGKTFDTAELFTLVMNSIPFAISWKDLDFVYRGCNQNFANLVGLNSPADVLGKTDEELPWAIGPASIARWRERDETVIASGISLMHIIESRTLTDGTIVWTESSKAPVRDRNGDLVGVLGMIEDITERKILVQTVDELNRMLQDVSRIDSLTQVANRRYFSERLDQEWSRAQREGYELSIILFDLDNFKAFNATYGDFAGDACLVETAFVTTSVIRRSSDILARYGGEEFVVLLPKAGLDGACSIAEELRSEIAALRVHVGGEALNTTASFGVAACVPGVGEMPSVLISKAAEMLEFAKNSGRNRVIAGR